jgi:AraC-like DNA-binding protein
MIIDKLPMRTQKCFDDFLEFSYLFNDPALLLNDLIHLSLADHDPLKQSLSLDILLCRASMYYHQIEQGFWLLYSEIDVKENFVLKSDHQKNLPNDYYIVTLSVFDCKFSIKDTEDINYEDSCWTLSKPQTVLNSRFYSHTSGTVVSFAINKDWVRLNLLAAGIAKKTIDLFLNGKKGFFSGAAITKKNREIMIKIGQELKNQHNVVFDELSFRKNCIKLIVGFFNSCFGSNDIINTASLTNSDYYNVLKAEKIILDNLYLPFVGIDYIAREIRISPAKLQANFKTVFGFSMLRYHKEKNLLLAIQLIQNSDIPIRNIAAVTGYENAGKFSYSFKKRFGNLPRYVTRVGCL